MKEQPRKVIDHKAIESKKRKLIYSRKMDDRGKGSIEAAADISAYENLAWAFADLGRAYANTGMSQKASEYLGKGINIIQGFADMYKEDPIISNSHDVKNPPCGVYPVTEDFEKNAVIVPEKSNLQKEVKALYKTAKAYEDAGEILKAIEFYVQALAIYRIICHRTKKDVTTGKLGSIDVRQGEHCYEIDDKARRLAKVCKIQIQNVDNTSLSNFYRAYEGVGWAFADLGMCQFFLDDDSRAVEPLENALIIIQELEDKDGEASIFSTLGDVYYDLGEFQKSINYHEKALVIRQEIRNPLGEGFSLDKLGNGYFELGETHKAIEFFERCLELAQEISDRMMEVQSLEKLGLAYFDMGEPQKAIKFYEQALVLYRGIGNRCYKDITFDDLKKPEPDFVEAGWETGFCNQFLVIVRKIDDWRSEGKTLSMLGTAYADLGETSTAIKIFEQALVIQQRIGDRFYECISLGNLGYTYYQIGEKEKGIVGMRQALTICEEIKSPFTEWARKNLKEWEESICV